MPTAVVVRMTSSLVSAERAHQDSDRRRSVRNAFLVVALVWSVVGQLPWLPLRFSPALTEALVIPHVVGAVPICVLLVVTIRRPAITRHTYWFLPLYFAGDAATVTASLALGIFRFAPVSDSIALWSRSALPELVIAAALWLARPAGADDPSEIQP